MAGRIAVAITGTLVERVHVVLDGDGGLLTPGGRAFLAGLGVELPEPRPKRRVFCRPCLDWSERRPHLAGAVGGVLLAHALRCDWVRRVPDSRALAAALGVEVQA